MAAAPVKHYHAAGGVVLDDRDRVLLLERHVERAGTASHELRLPKGHIEAGETAEQAAVREVCEESGYCNVTIIADLGAGITEFTLPDRSVRREEHYYLMRLQDGSRHEPFSPHAHSEEHLFVPVWAAGLDEAESMLTFESEKRFVRRASHWLGSGNWQT